MNGCRAALSRLTKDRTIAMLHSYTQIPATDARSREMPTRCQPYYQRTSQVYYQGVRATPDVRSRSGWVSLALVALCICTSTAYGQSTEPDTPNAQEGATLAGSDYGAKAKATPQPEVETLGGSVQRVDEATLRAMNYVNPERVVTTIPGVNARIEDGYGLRPNIGIRGVNSHRSHKITLLEDGVLQAYAPYSAPSTFSMTPMSRVVGVDVIKGPSAILYGPQTLAGAIDFRTRDVPDGTHGFAELSYGMRNYVQAHLFAGSSNDTAGVSIEGLENSIDGFQTTNGQKYFDRSNGYTLGDYALRAFWKPWNTGAVRHRLSAKLVYQHERSNETYLGLTDADFDANPIQRYAASANDEFRRQSTQIELRDTITLGDHGSLDIVAYRHDTHRIWHRLDRFGNKNVTFLNVLNHPDDPANQSYLDVLRGVADSANADQQLIYVLNDWTYVSEGVQAEANYHISGRIRQDIRAGARIHYDSYDRHIPAEAWDMLNGSLSRSSTGTTLQNDDLSQTTALSGYAYDAVSVGDFTLAPGIRAEYIDMHYSDYVKDSKVHGTMAIALPGVSLSYAPIEPLRIFTGVHRGFSPPLPQDIQRLNPETSVNYELGARYRGKDGLQLELAGFFSDYNNMAYSTCASCTDPQYHRYGEAYIGGLEAGAGYTFRVGRFEVPMRANYTFIKTSVRKTFDSQEQQLTGDVNSVTIRRGDELPYVPKHQGSFLTGVTFNDKLALTVQGTYTAAMREQLSSNGQDVKTDDYFLLDVAGRWQVSKHIALTTRFENVLDQRRIASRRPWGARPTAPFQAQVGARIEL